MVLDNYSVPGSEFCRDVRNCQGLCPGARRLLLRGNGFESDNSASFFPFHITAMEPNSFKYFHFFPFSRIAVSSTFPFPKRWITTTFSFDENREAFDSRLLPQQKFDLSPNIQGGSPFPPSLIPRSIRLPCFGRRFFSHDFLLINMQIARHCPDHQEEDVKLTNVFSSATSQ